MSTVSNAKAANPAAAAGQAPDLGVAPLPSVKAPVQGVAAASAPASQERTVISLAGKQYWIDADKSTPAEIAYLLYELSDIRAKKPIGRIVKNPATGKFKKPVLFPSTPGGE